MFGNRARYDWLVDFGWRTLTAISLLYGCQPTSGRGIDAVVSPFLAERLPPEAIRSAWYETVFSNRRMPVPGNIFDAPIPPRPKERGILGRRFYEVIRGAVEPICSWWDARNISEG